MIDALLIEWTDELKYLVWAEQRAVMMTRLLPRWYDQHKEQIDAAVAQIGPKPDQNDACRKAVTKATVDVSFDASLRQDKVARYTKDGKEALNNIARGLRLIDKGLKNESLDSDIKSIVSSILADDFPTEWLKEYADSIAKMAEVTTKQGSLPRQKAKAKKLAIGHAHSLLVRFSSPEIANNAKDKKSRFCKLAAIVCGDPDIDLSIQCQNYLREWKKLRSLVS